MVKGEKVANILDEEKFNYKKMKTRGVLVNFDEQIDIW